MVTDTARTANISTDAEIREAIAYIADHSAKVGRAEPPKVISSSEFTIRPGGSAQEAIDPYGQLQTLGIDGSGASIQAETRSEWCELALRFGDEVIAKMA